MFSLLNFLPDKNHQTLIERIVSEISDTTEHEPPLQKPQSKAERQAGPSCSFWDCFEEFGASQPRTENPGRCSINTEMTQFFSEKSIQRQENPYAWWAANKYNIEGRVYEQHRNRLLPANGEMLSCMNRNLKFLETN